MKKLCIQWYFIVPSELKIPKEINNCIFCGCFSAREFELIAALERAEKVL